MTADTKPTLLAPARGKIAALLMASLVPVLVLACAPQMVAQAVLPPAVNPMKVLLTQTGDLGTTPVNGENQPLKENPGHQASKDHIYDFGAAGSGADVCFWDEAKPDKQFCWPNTASAWIFINPQGDLTHAQQASGQPIPPTNRNAMMIKQWYYGHGTPFCIWSIFGGCYCWDV
jgi:hypothetical protein